jgi:uncharacterized membrane protein
MVATLYEWLMLVHVLAAMVWLGGLVSLTVLAWGILRSGDGGAAVRFASLLGTVGPRVFAPAVVVVIGCGIGMVVDSPAWSFGQTWVRLALALFSAVFFVGVALQSRAGIGAGRAAAAGDVDGAVRHVRRWSRGNVLVLAILLLITWDMIFKPGL